MAAGITVPYDTLGLQTADLVKNQWPTRPGEPRPKEYTSTNYAYGIHVPCHATQSYQAPTFPAGTSKRMGAFYEKTGVLQHRTEPGFRDTKGRSGLTETAIPDYGTLRKSTRLPGTASMILRTPALSEKDPPMVARINSPGAASRRSKASTASRRSEARSEASSVPSWAARSAALRANQPWNFEALPMYERTNASYGKCHTMASMAQRVQPAGKSESGFMEPSELIAALTRREY